MAAKKGMRTQAAVRAKAGRSTTPSCPAPASLGTQGSALGTTLTNQSSLKGSGRNDSPPPPDGGAEGAGEAGGTPILENVENTQLSSCH